MNNDCDCVPGHFCDCGTYRDLLIDILTNAEYEKVAAEGRAADALGLIWDETCGDRFQAPPITEAVRAAYGWRK